MIRIRIDRKNLERVPFLTNPFREELERKAAYEEVFYGSQAGLRVLADILKRSGATSASFVSQSGTLLDPVNAAHNDGQKAAALEILRMAGGNAHRLARALVMDDAKETRDET